MAYKTAVASLRIQVDHLIMRRPKKLLTVLFTALIAELTATCQTPTTAVDLAQQGRNPDFSAMPVTRPISVGSALPTTCIIGQLFFNTTAAAGSNLYACSSVNAWTVIGAVALRTSGNATAIQGINVLSSPPINNQVLLYSQSAAGYIPTSIYTLQAGLGTATAGSTNLQVNISMGIRKIATTTDTIVNTDCGGLVLYTNAAPVTVALPQAGLGGNFAAGCPIMIHNYGSGNVTFLASVGSIGGQPSQQVVSNKGCQFVSDGTNWQLGNCN